MGEEGIGTGTGHGDQKGVKGGGGRDGSLGLVGRKKGYSCRKLPRRTEVTKRLHRVKKKERKRKSRGRSTIPTLNKRDAQKTR